MNRLPLAVLALALASGGCYRPRGDQPEPEPTPSADPIDQAAYDACRAHAAGLAKVANDTADKAATFTSHADAVDFGATANKAAREAAFKPVYDLIDAALDPQHKPYDADATAKVFRSFASGAERASK